MILSLSPNPHIKLGAGPEGLGSKSGDCLPPGGEPVPQNRVVSGGCPPLVLGRRFLFVCSGVEEGRAFSNKPPVPIGPNEDESKQTEWPGPLGVCTPGQGHVGKGLWREC